MVLVYLLAKGMTTLGYHWQWYRVPRYLFSVTPKALLQDRSSKDSW